MLHFVNNGYGWTCRRCGARESGRADDGEARGRFFEEGEDERDGTPLASGSLARWRDASRRTLVCPRCGVEETLEDAAGAALDG